MKIAFSCIAFFSCILVTAQETSPVHTPINTDRPDQTESPYLLSKKQLQIETGFSFEENSNTYYREKSWTYASFLFRYGLLDNFELRLGFDVSESHIENSFFKKVTASGMSPLYIGFKIGIAEEKGLLPQIGFLGGVFLPFSAAQDFKPQGTGSEFRFAFAHTLSNKFDFSYNIGVAWNGQEPEVDYVYSVVLGYAITEKLSAFVEVYGDFPEDAESGHLLDGGFTYLLSDNIQVDLAGGTGISTDQDFFVGAGISVRLPN